MRQVHFFIAIYFAVLFSSCKKDSDPIVADVATVNIINALPGSSGLIANFNNMLSTYNGQSATYYSSYRAYYITGGSTSLSLRQDIDTLHAVYNGVIDLPKNTVHSLFITGTIGSPEAVLTTDNLPYHAPQGHGTSDSVAGIRFANMLVGGGAVSVNIAGGANGSEIASLAYKSVTDFKDYSAASTVSSYTFEFRDASNGVLLTSYTLPDVSLIDPNQPNNVRFKNLTLVLSGVANGTGSDSPGAFVVNNF